MAPVRVPISQEVLQWAISRTRQTPEELSTQTDFKQIHDWVEGKKQPTLNQAKSLAKKAGLPFGVLLLPEPIDISPDLPDFRTEKNTRLRDTSKELEEQIFLSQRSLNWYVDNAARYGAPRPELLRSAILTQSPETVADRTRDIIDWFPAMPTGGRTHLTILAKHIEEHGILVMKGSTVGNNNHSRLDRDEFRGFTLIRDGYALIFINTAEAPSANLFSLAHELGHVVLGKHGVSSDEEHNRIERWCNKFAAALLLPKESLTDSRIVEPIDLEYLRDKSRQLGPSVEAIVWRMVTLNLLNSDTAHALVHQWKKLTIQGENERKSSGGPRPEIMARARLGSNFLSAISEAYSDGSLTYRDASRLIGYKKVSTLEAILDIRPVMS
ncbi:ImmA/IrrE family metallo-endopeptidase [Corynebacterium pyruviciproducens]|uniref:ImmA/IrrE family metallo-endopeptidase n=1 Tax=Corynebacterium pyruviciproducens TaxID=598660 RepID=A0AAF0YV39_9CORY|nr:ImmA/IrrE family metallo-endopeptidase [Corynebacterium pyruviciproducens]MDK7215526.1 ImmA/IrrE family metallo-endopeptidase [Corynebacterium pyruviciproducens]WOT02026.1 ImmA/IrrE family metallo-endopeptidase [Corynebacterium pyruviciproducens]